MAKERKHYEKEIIDECVSSLNDISNFYTKDFINYRGKTCDTKKPFMELVIKFINDHIDQFENNISTITRNKSYNCNHKVKYVDNDSEKILAKNLHYFSKHDNQIYSYIGKIIDYETPLKNELYSKSTEGQIDLLSFSQETNKLHLIEFKKDTNNETLLRCILEIYTYYKILDKEKILIDFKDDLKGSSANIKIAPTVLVFKNGRQYEDFECGKESKNKTGKSELLELMNKLKIELYFIEKIDESYKVTKGLIQED